ncbi:hypothetical protein [Microbispora sp. NPDC049125]|uniref:hypothetical protein n=1 Tax=Microbispora sp. NPDC049125 TaxID=3154929 RepID=UPI003464FB94
MSAPDDYDDDGGTYREAAERKIASLRAQATALHEQAARLEARAAEIARTL